MGQLTLLDPIREKERIPGYRSVHPLWLLPRVSYAHGTRRGNNGIHHKVPDLPKDFRLRGGSHLYLGIAEFHSHFADGIPYWPLDIYRKWQEAAKEFWHHVDEYSERHQYYRQYVEVINVHTHKGFQSRFIEVIMMVTMIIIATNETPVYVGPQDVREHLKIPLPATYSLR